MDALKLSRGRRVHIKVVNIVPVPIVQDDMYHSNRNTGMDTPLKHTR